MEKEEHKKEIKEEKIDVEEKKDDVKRETEDNKKEIKEEKIDVDEKKETQKENKKHNAHKENKKHKSNKTSKKSKPKKENNETKKTSKSKKVKQTKGFYMWLVLLFVIVTGLVYYNYDVLFGEKDIAAKVNNEVITMAELEAQHNALPEIYKSMMPKESLLDRIIDFVLLRQNAEKNGIEVSNKEIDLVVKYLSFYLTDEEFEKEIESYGGLRNFKNELKETRMVQKFVTENVIEFMHTEDEIKQMFEEYSEVLGKEYVRAKHLIICHEESFNCESNKTKEEAFEFIQNIKEEVNINNFEEFAIEFSEDGSARQGGDLGWFTRGEMAQEFEDVVFSLEEGEISEIVETEFGYHLILMLSKREPIEVEFEELRPFIEFTVFNQIQQQANHAFLNFAQELREDADIEIFLDVDDQADFTIEDVQIVDQDVDQEIVLDEVSDEIFDDIIIIDDEDLVDEFIEDEISEKCFDVDEKIIFYYQEDSERSLEMKEIVDEFDNILYIKRTDNVEFIEDCIEDFRRTIVPQLICSNNNEVILGSTSKEEFNNFYNNC